MTAKMSTMSGHNPESIAMNDSVRAPRLVQIADGLATAVAVSLPWSTSATSILIALWLIALVPTLDPSSVRREVLSAAGGLPLLLWALGAIGMLWADVSWSDRIAGLSGFHKLLFIPLLLAQFRRSGQAKWAIFGFLASSVVLLVVSWALVLICGLASRGQKPRRAGQGLHHAERNLRDLRFRTARAGRRAVAHAGAAFARPPSCRAGVHRQHRLCGDGAHHTCRHGGHVRAVRGSAIRMEGGARRRTDRRRADGRGVGIFAISAPARVGCRGRVADLRRWRRQHPDRAADRVLEEIARFHRRGASHRPWYGDHSRAVPARCDGRDQSRADHHESA